jgi:hydrogenase expression/formation protein HypD
MKHVDEWRDPTLLRALAERIARETTRPWTLLEVCGGQTHAFVRFGLLDLLPPTITMVHGPGCPVCVTPLEVLERARRIALRPEVILCTYGDMLRVPGVHGDLLSARADGADVRVVSSPLEALDLARRSPHRVVVFLAVGFETTAPATAALIELADREALTNLHVLTAHVRVPPALEALFANHSADVNVNVNVDANANANVDANADADANANANANTNANTNADVDAIASTSASPLDADAPRIHGLLAAGHVCTIEGTDVYAPLAERFGIPIVVTGFEPVDLLRGVLACMRRLERGETGVENAYARIVRPEGNPLARAAVDRVFAVADVPWRGFGVLPGGGLAIRERFAAHDATRHFTLPLLDGANEPIREPTSCRAADVLRGRLRPLDCPELGRRCTPETPLGAPMVSSEGACAAYFSRRRAHALVPDGATT